MRPTVKLPSVKLPFTTVCPSYETSDSNADDSISYEAHVPLSTRSTIEEPILGDFTLGEITIRVEDHFRDPILLSEAPEWILQRIRTEFDNMDQYLAESIIKGIEEYQIGQREWDANHRYSGEF